MKVIKEGLLIFIIILLFSNFVYATDSLNLSLTTTKIGASTPFEGYLNFQFSGVKPLDSPINFYVGTSKIEVPLRDIFTILNTAINVTPQKYDTSGDTKSSIDINFDAAGSKIEAGIDLRGQLLRNPEQLILREEDPFVYLDISPTAAGNPKDIVITLQNQTLYKYRGAPLDWIELNKSYLASAEGQGSVEMSGGDIFCQIVGVQDSNEYKLKILAKKNSSLVEDVKLNLTMIDLGSEPIKPDCSDARTPCCSVTLSKAFNETSCTVNKIIAEPTKQYICAYPSGGEDTSINYFSIKTDNQGSGIANGAAIDYTFYIYGDYRTYDSLLTQKTNAKIPIQYFEDYIHGSGCDNNCLLIPLNISISNKGGVSLSGLILRYIYQLKTEENNFKKLTFVPETVNYLNKLSIGLNNLKKVISPQSLGNSSIYASFNGLETSKVKFEVVASPRAFIRYSPLNPSLNQEVLFDANSSTSPNNKSLVSYMWDFGDSSLIGNGVRLNHIFNQTGSYNVTLKVVDSDGIYNFDKVEILIENESLMDISSFVNQTQSIITQFKTNLETSPAQVKDTASLLGITNSLSAFEANLSNIQKNYELLFANDSTMDSNKSAIINAMTKQIKDILAKIPKTLNVDSASFSAKITGLNQIPSCCEFTTELQKNKLLSSQQDIKVSGDARNVNIIYSDGRTESFMIIKKEISGTGSKVYEYLPISIALSPQNVLSGGSVTVAAANVYSFPFTSVIAYKVENADLSQALQAKTIVLPLSLETIQVNDTSEEIKQAETLCGNKICETGEDETTCQEDCKEPNNTLFIILGIIIILIIAVVYFGYFFKGGLFKKKSLNNASFLFKNDKDHISVKTYVEHSLKTGITEDKIHVALKSKGWNDLQINGVINEVKNEKAKPQTKPEVHTKH